MTVPIAHQPSQQRGTWDVTPRRSRGSGPPGLLERSFRLRHDSFRCKCRPQASRLGVYVASRVMLERIGPAMEPGEGQMGNVGLYGSWSELLTDMGAMCLSMISNLHLLDVSDLGATPLAQEDGPALLTANERES
jgi:hypothetical protein